MMPAQSGGARKRAPTMTIPICIGAVIAAVVWVLVESRRAEALDHEIEERRQIAINAWARACAPDRSLFRGGNWWCRRADGAIYLPEFAP